MEQQDVPSGWWNAEADRCLLIGVFKHGKQLLVLEIRVFKRLVYDMTLPSLYLC